MYICPFCKTSYDALIEQCLQCGASVFHGEKTGSAKQAKDASFNEIRQLCEHYMLRYVKEFHDYEAVSNAKKAKIIKAFSVYPIDADVFLYVDTTTPLRSGKRGFMVCSDGIYWQNHWSTRTQRNFLSWNMFKNKVIELNGYDLDLGEGDAIGLTGLGDVALREVVRDMFLRIQEILREMEKGG